MDVQFYTPVRKDAGAGGDSHPYQCYKAHGGNRAYLVKMVLERNGSICKWRAGIHHNIGQFK
jgi:hypothetical protein